MQTGWRRQFTLVEVLLLAGISIAFTAFLTMRQIDVINVAADASITKTSGEEAMFVVRAREDLAPITAKYGSAHHSRYVEELVIRDYFQDRRDGVFLDVGANHYKNESNTYYLEKELGWSGVAVDALPEFGPDYATNRPRTKFVAMFASDVDGQKVTLFEPEKQKLIASVNQDFTARMGEQGKAREVPTATLDRLLQEANVDRLDFLSMDIELAEPKALAGFNLQKYRPSLVCIEVHPEVRQQILDYFASGGYVIVGKYLRIDPTNLYFQPLAMHTPTAKVER
jgi:FkbM family methyltransferase